MKSNAGRNKIKSTVVNCRICLVATRGRKTKSNKNNKWDNGRYRFKNKTLNRQKTDISIKKKHYNVSNRLLYL